MPKKRDPRLARYGLKGYNKPKRTPNHPKKSHVVLAKVGSKVKLIRFGQQGVKELELCLEQQVSLKKVSLLE